MPISKKAGEYLVPLDEYAVTTVDQTLTQAVPKLRKLYCEVEDGRCTEAGHRNILVLNQKGDLVGIMDFKSILNVLIPECAGGLSAKLESLGVTIAFAQAGSLDQDEARLSFRARVIKNAETLVKDVMLRIRGSIDYDADLMDALRILCNNRITVLPVYKDGKLVGVLRDSDLFLAIAEILEQ